MPGSNETSRRSNNERRDKESKSSSEGRGEGGGGGGGNSVSNANLRAGGTRQRPRLRRRRLKSRGRQRQKRWEVLGGREGEREGLQGKSDEAVGSTGRRHGVYTLQKTRLFPYEIRITAGERVPFKMAWIAACIHTPPTSHALSPSVLGTESSCLHGPVHMCNT